MGNLGGTNSTSATPTMRNPWTALPKNPPYVLASDVALLEGFNATASARHRYDLSLFPEPFFGSATAPVVVLNLNPGWSPEDAAVHADPIFAAMSRRSLEHTLDPYPFLHLQPDSNTPGATWWRQRTRELASDVGFDQAARQLACVQLVPYHSSEYAGSSPRLPSQEYSFQLVRQAMLRGAEVVIMRSANLWFAAVPELANYSRVHRGSNPRAPFVSRGNLKSSYIVLERVRSAARNR